MRKSMKNARKFNEKIKRKNSMKLHEKIKGKKLRKSKEKCNDNEKLNEI